MLVGADGTPLKVHGVTTIRVGTRADGKVINQAVYVCERLKHEVLLGLNFLNCTQAILNFQRNVLLLWKLGTLPI